MCFSFSVMLPRITTGNGAQLYLDGSLVGQSVASGLWQHLSDTRIGEMNVENATSRSRYPINVLVPNATSNTAFSGRLGDIRMYDRGVTLAEVQQMYQECLPLPSTTVMTTGSPTLQPTAAPSIAPTGSPTTPPPPTEAPTTFAPTTLAPTTLAPTLAANAGQPTTFAPTTLSPTRFPGPTPAPVVTTPPPFPLGAVVGGAVGGVALILIIVGIILISRRMGRANENLKRAQREQAQAAANKSNF